MATNKRMFSNDIVGSDFFLDMPTSTQALYFHLGMQADDRGFVQPKRVMRMLGSTDNELQMLLAKKFLLVFEDGVVLIKHWRMNNNKIDADRFKETTYLDHLSSVFEKENKSYTLDKTQGLPIRAHFVHSLGTQNRIEENRIDKNKEEELPLWLDKDSWNEWIQYRKSRKLTTSKITISRQLKLLEQYKQNHKAIIEKSITMGWQGLFPDKNKVVLDSVYFIEDTRTGKKSKKQFSSKEEAERFISLNRDWDDIKKFLKVVK